MESFISNYAREMTWLLTGLTTDKLHSRTLCIKQSSTIRLRQPQSHQKNNDLHRKITPQQFPDINFISFDIIQKLKLKKKKKNAPFVSKRKKFQFFNWSAKNSLVVQTVPLQVYKKSAIFEKVKTVFQITFYI